MYLLRKPQVGWLPSAVSTARKPVALVESRKSLFTPKLLLKNKESS
jgi:hypothetical protein